MVEQGSERFPANSTLSRVILEESNMIKKIATAFAALALAGAAHAYAGLATDAPPQAYTFSEGTSGAGFLTFTLDGYGSLDGANNCCTDVFTVKQGSTVLFSGSFNLGGGGETSYIVEPAGTVVTDVHGSTLNQNVTWAGGELTFIVPVSYVSGSNLFTFAYSSPTGVQGTGDEGWAVSKVALAVPEAGSMAMLLAGLAVIGGLSRRRNRA